MWESTQTELLCSAPRLQSSAEGSPTKVRWHACVKHLKETAPLGPWGVRIKRLPERRKGFPSPCGEFIWPTSAGPGGSHVLPSPTSWGSLYKEEVKINDCRVIHYLSIQRDTSLLLSELNLPHHTRAEARTLLPAWLHETARQTDISPKAHPEGTKRS